MKCDCPDVSGVSGVFPWVALMGSLVAWFHFGSGFWAALFWEYWAMVPVIAWIGEHQ